VSAITQASCASAGADELGFATLWCGEHVVMVDEPGSRYPYADDATQRVSELAARWLAH
jgi:hypothetical protein